jgi:hypothetical protein
MYQTNVLPPCLGSEAENNSFNKKVWVIVANVIKQVLAMEVHSALVRINEEVLERKSNSPGLENRD